MTCWVQGNRDLTKRDWFSIWNTYDFCAVTKASAQKIHAHIRAIIKTRAAPGMIAVGMGHDGNIDRSTGIDMESATSTKQAFLGKLKHF